MSRRAELERLVRTHSKLELQDIADDDVLGHELGFDSQALLSLLLEVEDRFDLEVPPEQVTELAGAPFARLLTLVEQAAGAPEPKEARP